MQANPVSEEPTESSERLLRVGFFWYAAGPRICLLQVLVGYHSRWLL